MIPNQWYILLESKQVPRHRPVGVTRMGEKMVFWRDAQGRAACAVDLCPHRGAALSAGKVIGDCVECPFHGFRFDPSGRCALIPANGRAADVPQAMRLRVYPVEEKHGFIYVWWGEPRAEYPPLPAFDFMEDAHFVHVTWRDTWRTHYSRAIENQLDVVHLPFVHANTIGRGGMTLVNGPRYRVTDYPGGMDRLEFWADNEVDHGQKPLRPDEMLPTDRHPQIQYRFPNIWHNWLGDTFHLFIAFAPVDAENCVLYICMYHTVRLPVLRQIFELFGMLGNIYIERQDRRVVVTQRPLRTELRMGEKLIYGDAPIIEYRRRRQRMIENALSHQPRGLAANLDGEVCAAVPGVDLTHAGEVQPGQGGLDRGDVL
jgi:phenylpropionate dioxygenase-like ring-hydroxylating dioxygenase large terminal subunit